MIWAMQTGGAQCAEVEWGQYILRKRVLKDRRKWELVGGGLARVLHWAEDQNGDYPGKCPKDASCVSTHIEDLNLFQAHWACTHFMESTQNGSLGSGSSHLSPRALSIDAAEYSATVRLSSLIQVYWFSEWNHIAIFWGKSHRNCLSEIPSSKCFL